MVPRRAAKRTTLPVLLLVVLSAADLAGQMEADPVALEGEIDAFVRREMAAAGIPGLALGIVHGTNVVYLKGFGFAGPGGDVVTPDTRFYLGSVSKTLTGIAVMQLVERGLATLDDPVSRHLSWFWTDRITITHLLNHTSGISPYAGNDSGIERTEDLVERIRSKSRLGLAGEPGTRFRYSSLNYDILGAVVEAVGGMPYERYMDLSVFQPLEMRNTTADHDPAEADVAAGYTPWFGLRLPYRIRYPRSAAPSGYIVSTARDMTHLLVAELNRGRYRDSALLGEAAMAATQTSLGATGYAMGWSSAASWKWHTGELANYNAYLWIVPTRALGLVMLANTNDIATRHIAGSTSALRRIPEGIRGLLMGFPLPPAPVLTARGLYVLLDAAIGAVLAVAALLLFRRPRAPIRRRAAHLAVSVAVMVPAVILPFAARWAIHASIAALLVSVPDLTLSLVLLSLLLLTGGLIRIARLCGIMP